MPKRRPEFSSSPSSSADTDGDSSNHDPSFSLGSVKEKMRKKLARAILTIEKRSRKKARKEQGRNDDPVASTSTQLQPDVEIILKDEIEESDLEVEHSEVADSPEETTNLACSSRSPDHQLEKEVRRSKRERVTTQVWSFKPQQPPKKVPKPHEKYFEGCLIMGCFKLEGFPYWPGIIRKPGEDYEENSDYIRHKDGKTSLCVQFFFHPAVVVWRMPQQLRIFDAAKPNRCNQKNPKYVEWFEQGIRVAKAAANYSIEARLLKFTLSGAWTNGIFLGNGKTTFRNLVAEIDSVNSHSTTNAPQPPGHQNDLLALTRDDAVATTQETGGSSTHSGVQNADESTHQATGKGESCPDSVEIMKKRISEYQQKLREECNWERDETMKSLTTDNSRLATENNNLKMVLEGKTEAIMEKEKVIAENEKVIVEKQKVIAEKQKVIAEKDKVIAELQEKHETGNQEKLKYKQELEEIKTLFDEMFGIQT